MVERKTLIRLKPIVMKKIRILALDGGGIRGILPGTILTYLEEQIRKETGNEEAYIGEYFDFLAGTSTGGILCLSYIIPDANGKFIYSAREALNVYLERGGEIFDAALSKKIVSLGGILDEKYRAKELEQTLLNYFKDRQLSEVLKPCLIPAYDMENRRAHFFTSVDARRREENDYFLRDIGRATSAAPTFFEPVLVRPLKGNSKAFIDGGVFANNPVMCAYAEARNIAFSEVLQDVRKPDFPTAKNMLILSIGTGEVKKPYPYQEFKNAGVLKWMKPLIDIMMSGNSETVDYQLRQIYKTLSEEDAKDYHRIQPNLKRANSAIDDAKASNLRDLYLDGVDAVQQYKKQLDEIVIKLIANH